MIPTKEQIKVEANRYSYDLPIIFQTIAWSTFHEAIKWYQKQLEKPTEKLPLKDELGLYVNENEKK